MTRRPVSAVALMMAGCSGNQSALDPAGPQAGHILSLFLLMTGTCAAIFLTVMIALGLALLRARRNPPPDRPNLPLRPDAAAEWRHAMAVGIATVGTVMVLCVFVIDSYVTDRRLAALAGTKPVDILVVGHQWWWEVRYLDPEPARNFTTANEIHIPVGRPVILHLRADDVVHSFWIPNLRGKKDLIPGRDNDMTLRADRPGTFRGQCAEFCGLQHAKMGFLVVAEPEDRYRAWAGAQVRPAPEPAGDGARRGQAVFLSTSCMMCHAIGGTTAQSRAGPDLTHLAARQTIAAGSLPNSRGNLAGWILDPQGVKPGNHMPLNPMPSRDFQDLLDYLETLQ